MVLTVQYHQPVAGEVIMIANPASKSDSANRLDSIFYNVTTNNADDDDDQLDSELQLKKMISYVEPLTAIFLSDRNNKPEWKKQSLLRTSRETHSSATGRLVMNKTTIISLIYILMQN